MLSGERLPQNLRDPQELRRRVVEAFGYARFRERVASLLTPLVAGAEHPG
jgi:hypothetical protein